MKKQILSLLCIATIATQNLKINSMELENNQIINQNFDKDATTEQNSEKNKLQKNEEEEKNPNLFDKIKDSTKKGLDSAKNKLAKLKNTFSSGKLGDEYQQEQTKNYENFDNMQNIKNGSLDDLFKSLNFKRDSMYKAQQDARQLLEKNDAAIKDLVKTNLKEVLDKNLTSFDATKMNSELGKAIDTIFTKNNKIEYKEIKTKYDENNKSQASSVKNTWDKTIKDTKDISTQVKNYAAKQLDLIDKLNKSLTSRANSLKAKMLKADNNDLQEEFLENIFAEIKKNNFSEKNIEQLNKKISENKNLTKSQKEKLQKLIKKNSADATKFVENYTKSEKTIFTKMDKFSLTLKNVGFEIVHAIKTFAFTMFYGSAKAVIGIADGAKAAGKSIKKGAEKTGEKIKSGTKKTKEIAKNLAKKAKKGVSDLKNGVSDFGSQVIGGTRRVTEGVKAGVKTGFNSYQEKTVKS